MGTMQVQLTAAQQRSLQSLAADSGYTVEELVQEAVDQYLSSVTGPEYRDLIRRGAGLWQDREDLTEFEARRAEFDRRPGR